MPTFKPCTECRCEMRCEIMRGGGECLEEEYRSGVSSSVFNHLIPMPYRYDHIPTRHDPTREE